MSCNRLYRIDLADRGSRLTLRQMYRALLTSIDLDLGPDPRHGAGLLWHREGDLVIVSLRPHIVFAPTRLLGRTTELDMSGLGDGGAEVPVTLRLVRQTPETHLNGWIESALSQHGVTAPVTARALSDVFPTGREEDGALPAVEVETALSADQLRTLVTTGVGHHREYGFGLPVPVEYLA